MSGAAVVFDSVWKKFRRGERHDSLRDLLPSMARQWFGAGRSQELSGDQEFWAIKDVSFEVSPGEALGIIGPNGAGKSTALKLLTRILRPTRGECHVHGRVGALIEVAAGFHPDLTGRENIFLQGAIMGMRRAEIAAKLNPIVEFAGVGEFINTPVKRYSSGMNARLGFSIAAHLDPDVLIIDEVLSVGDINFQQRCVNRMLEFKRNGATIVFVSHDLSAISRLCDRAVLLNRTLAAIGPTSDILKTYVRGSVTNNVRSTGEVTIEHATLTTATGVPTQSVEPGDQLILEVAYRVHQHIDDFHLGFLVHRSTDGLLVYDESFSQESLGLGALSPGQALTMRYRFSAHVTRGQYDIELHVYRVRSQTFPIRLRPAAIFQVDETASYAGIAHLGVRAAVANLAGAPPVDREVMSVGTLK